MSYAVNDGGPAFPVPNYVNADGETFVSTPSGMSLRDYFAAHIVVGPLDIDQSMGEAIVGEKCPTWEPSNTAKCVQWWAEAEAKYRYIKADAMLKARSQ